MATLVALLLIATTFVSDTAVQTSPDPRELVLSQLKVTLPVTVERIDILPDGGGSRSIHLRDAKGQSYSLVKDSREPRFKPPIPDGRVHKLEPYPRYVYWGAGHYDDPKAFPCSIGGPQEDAVIALLKSFVNTNLSEAAQDSIKRAKTEPPKSISTSLTSNQRFAAIVYGVYLEIQHQRLMMGKRVNLAVFCFPLVRRRP